MEYWVRTSLGKTKRDQDAVALGTFGPRRKAGVLATRPSRSYIAAARLTSFPRRFDYSGGARDRGTACGRSRRGRGPTIVRADAETAAPADWKVTSLGATRKLSVASRFAARRDSLHRRDYRRAIEVIEATGLDISCRGDGSLEVPKCAGMFLEPQMVYEVCTG